MTKRPAIVNVFLRAGLMLAVLACAGCAEKAQALKLAAGQFEAQAIQAVDTIDDMRKQEIAPAPRSQAQASQEFVDNIMATPATSIDVGLVEDAIDPYTVTVSDKAKRAWGDLLGDLRLQYRTFASIFDRIDAASLFAAGDVKKAAPYVKKLTAQMAYFADAIERAPPQLLQRQGALITELRAIRGGGASDAEKKQAIAVWRDKWSTLRQDEAELKRRVVEQCLKTAVIGVELGKKIEDYDKVTLDEITGDLKLAFQIAGDLTGNDFSKLSNRAAGIAAKIKADSTWSSVTDVALKQVNEALNNQQ